MFFVALSVGLLIALNLFSLLNPDYSFTLWWSRPFRVLFFRVFFLRAYHQGISYRHAWQVIFNQDEHRQWLSLRRHPGWEPNEEYCWMHERSQEPGYGGWTCSHPDCKKQIIEAGQYRKDLSPTLRTIQFTFLLLLMLMLLVGYSLVALHITLHVSLFPTF